MRPQRIMDTTNDINTNNQNKEAQEVTLPGDLLTRSYNEQIRLILPEIIPAALAGWAQARQHFGAEQVTAFDVCATLAIGCVELRTCLITGINPIFTSRFALDMPGVPYVDRALWEIVHLTDFEDIPHAHRLPFTQAKMRQAVLKQVSEDMAGAGITEPLTAELLDQQIALQEQQTRELVTAGDMTSFSMATETDRAISLIRLRLAGMYGVAVQVRKSNLSSFLGDLDRNFPTASVIAIEDHTHHSRNSNTTNTASNADGDNSASAVISEVSSHDYLGWLKA